MKKHEKLDWYQAKADNLDVDVYLYALTSFSEVWKWEITFKNTDKAVNGTNGWAKDLVTAKKDARDCAELFCGKGNLHRFQKNVNKYPKEE